jgi:hypothetical protein
VAGAAAAAAAAEEWRGGMCQNGSENIYEQHYFCLCSKNDVSCLV